VAEGKPGEFVDQCNAPVFLV